MRVWLYAMLMLCIGIWGGVAQANGLQITVFEDDTAALTIAEVSDVSASMPFPRWAIPWPEVTRPRRFG